MGRTGYRLGDCNYKPKHAVIIIITSMIDSKKRHRSEAEEWLYRLAKDPKQYEKRYIDSIKQMKHLIGELEKYVKKLLQQITFSIQRLLRQESN